MKKLGIRIEYIIGVFLLFLCFILYWLNMGNYAFLDTNETRFVSIAKDMLSNSDWINIKLNDENYFKYPPLLFWLINFSCVAFGKINAEVVRLPISIISSFGIILMFFMLKNMLSKSYAFIITLIFATSIGTLVFSRLATNDMLFCIFSLAAVLCASKTLFSRKNKQKIIVWTLVYLFIAFATMTCGVLGFVIPAVCIYAMYILSGNMKELFNPKHFVPGLIIFSLITFISLNFIALLCVYLLGDKLYLKALTETRGIKKNTLDIESVDDKRIGKSSITKWLLKKEWLVIKRTPIFMLNIVVIVFLMPLILAFSFIISFTSSGGDTNILLNIKDVTLYLKDPFIYLIVLAVSIFFTCTSVAASTAISREGNNAWFMKVIPVSYFKQINIKVLFANLIDILGVLVVMVFPIVIYKIPITYVLAILIPLCIIVTIMNYFNIWIDLKRPRLKWSEESEAVKQNLNAMISMFATMGLCVVFGIVAYIVYSYQITINVILLSILISIICGIILGLVIYYFYKNSDKLVKSID